jgi:NADPH-dependent glutamate synthase beta subunit-like oxidoreductase
VLTKKLSGAGVNVTELHGVEVEWVKGHRGLEMKERPGTEFTLKTDLVLIAMGFVHVAHGPLVQKLELALDSRGNIVTNDYATSAPGVFAAGDAAMGASLVVRAIAQGREAAAAVDRWLKSR